MKPLKDQSKTDSEQEEAKETSDLSTPSKGDVPPQEVLNSIEKPGTGIKLDTGTPSKTKTVMMMNWEMLNPQMRRGNKNRNLQLK
jgi:hypothetical protein